MEVAFLLVVIAVALAEWAVHRFAPAVAARWARFEGPKLRLRREAWPAARRDRRIWFGPPDGDAPAFLRVRGGTDPALARLTMRRVGGWTVVETTILPAVGISPYLFALLPLFVAALFGPPTWPGPVFTAILLVGWFVGVRALLVPGLRRQVKIAMREIFTELREAEKAATPPAGPRRKRKRRRR
jgi:hypothetical protein